MFEKYFSLTDDQIKDLFDNCRNLGICAAFFAAADWEFAQIHSAHSWLDIFNLFIFCVLILVGAWLFLVTHVHTKRKLKEYGLTGPKLTLTICIYTLITWCLLASIFLH